MLPENCHRFVLGFTLICATTAESSLLITIIASTPSQSPRSGRICARSSKPRHRSAGTSSTSAIRAFSRKHVNRLSDLNQIINNNNQSISHHTPQRQLVQGPALADARVSRAACRGYSPLAPCSVTPHGRRTPACWRWDAASATRPIPCSVTTKRSSCTRVTLRLVLSNSSRSITSHHIIADALDITALIFRKTRCTPVAAATPLCTISPSPGWPTVSVNLSILSRCCLCLPPCRRRPCSRPLPTYSAFVAFFAVHIRSLTQFCCPGTATRWHGAVPRPRPSRRSYAPL